MSDAEGLHGPDEMQRQRGDLSSVVVAVTDGQSTDHHVRVAYRLHLVHVIVVDDGVEQRVQVVQHVYDLRVEHIWVHSLTMCSI